MSLILHIYNMKGEFVLLGNICTVRAVDRLLVLLQSHSAVLFFAMRENTNRTPNQNAIFRSKSGFAQTQNWLWTLCCPVFMKDIKIISPVNVQQAAPPGKTFFLIAKPNTHSLLYCEITCLGYDHQANRWSDHILFKVWLAIPVSFPLIWFITSLFYICLITRTLFFTCTTDSLSF